MIEVEIRGKLNDEEYKKLKAFLEKEGEFVVSKDREMYLLYDYEGYSPDPIKREVDIRLRNTNGSCEIMMKTKSSHGNVARKEVSLALKDTDLETAKEIVKALGCKTALKMHRQTEVYNYKDIEWALVTCPKNIHYFEAEKEAREEGEIPAVKQELAEAAASLGVAGLNDEAMKEFIFWLDKEVNEEVTL
jgi:predicted adenylyl cyclase CyaB